jgi:uncharacterized surface protein with fasciclin (FAS1) repeats
MQKKLLALLGVVIASALVLAACQPAAQPTPETIVETRIVTEVVTEVVTEIVTEIVEVEAPVDRNGAWVDTVVMVADPSVESAVARILADDIDVYAQAATDTEALQTVQAEGLSYVTTVGSYNEITLNPADPMLNTGGLNPFGVPAIREAMNKLLDRDFVVQEILGGLGLPKYLPINGVFPDYANFAAKARELEAKYAYDPEAADAAITTEMEALGASKVDGVWTYEGEPVVLIGIIRTEDERLQIGDYVANQLESIGFTVDRQYKTSSEASPIWLRSDPAEGQWHYYTGGWITTAISRDDGGNFQFFYSPRSVYGFTPLWQAYQVTEEFDQHAQDLNNNNFTTLDERAVLFERALELALENSARVWLNDSTAFSPFAANVSVTYDLAGGISGTPLWAHTLRIKDEIGGQLTVAMSDLLVDPWNPLAGSNWVYDGMPQNAVSDFGVMPDPYTGLSLPQRIESASVTIEEGLPVGVTMDWVTLDFAPEIVVPGDAWVDWNAADQVFITADEKLAAMAAMPAMETDPGSIVDIAVADGRFTTLVAAVTAADLAGTLSGEGPFTVFAPTDDAFAKLPEGTVEGLLEDIPALTDILLYHVLGGYAPASKVVELEAATTLLGKNIEITLDEEGNVFINDAQVLITDIMANNGVIHVIDTVLLPPEEEGPEIPLVPTAITAKMKSMVTYPADLFETIKWHDGSPLTPADFVMSMILLFDQGYADSPIFDESQVGAVESFMAAFKGMKVASTDPLTIEFYSDNYSLDAENNVTTFWPQYNYGEAPWHMLALGIKAETDQELAFSADKADVLEVEWLGYTSGPSLEILRAKLDTAIEETYIPYAATLGQFITAEEAQARYANILDWYRIQGHFWVNSGPFYLNKVFPVEKTITLTRNPDFPDPADKWAGFGTPKIAEVSVDGPGRVTIGEEATYEAFVTFQGEPYASDEIKRVSYLLFDATGTLVEVGSAELVEEGVYSVTLSAETTAALEAGSNKLEMVVVPLTVSVPTFAAFEFVTAE